MGLEGDKMRNPTICTMRSWPRTWLRAAFIAVSALAISACAYLQHPKFGKLPEGADLARIERSPNYVNGEFMNLVETPMFTEGASFTSVLLGNLFSQAEGRRPDKPIPTVKTDLRALDIERDTVVWLGHSSYFVQLGGRRLLIDPVFSSYAAPVPVSNRAFPGTGIYTAEDMPPIDYLLITHDHWDHLDWASVTALQDKVKNVITALGVGSHLRYWGYPANQVHEGDWFDTIALEAGFLVHVVPARHFSGRLLTRNKTLWAGFVLEASGKRLLFGGDSGYGPHIAAIAAKFPSFDLVSLDSGQYDRRWAYLHMTPEETADAAELLRAKLLLPAHVGRFAMGVHPWDDPFKRIAAAGANRDFRLLMPRIGEPVWLDGSTQHFSEWWACAD